MSSRCFHQLFRLILLTLLSVVSPIAASAGDFVPFTDEFRVPVTTCDYKLTDIEDHCQWAKLDDVTGWGGCATHDSCPVSLSTDVVDDAASELSVSALVATAVTSAGVRVQQIIEPFAMVGPSAGSSLEHVTRFQAWWDSAIAQAESLRKADAAAKQESIQQALAAIVAEEPIDVTMHGPSILLTEEEPPAIKITRLDPLVGGSPMIATIEVEYLPYDLSARDLKLWSVLPTSTQPFCIRSRFDAFDWSPLSSDLEEDVAMLHESATEQIATDEVALAEPSTTNEFVVNVALIESIAAELRSSADRMLDEALGKMQTLSESQAMAEWAAPQSIGNRIGSLVNRGHRLTRSAVEAVAAYIPNVEDANPPTLTGGKLLAQTAEMETESEVAIAPAATDTTVR